MNINASLFVQMVVFFIGCWITMKFIWPPLIKAIEERQNKIAQGLAAADKSNEALAEAQAKGREIEAEARIENIDELIKQLSFTLSEALNMVFAHGER